MPKNVLAIDQGSTMSAVVWWDGTTIKAASIESNDDLEHALGEPWPDTRLAIERFENFGMPLAASTREAIFWGGRFAQAWVQASRRRIFERVTRRAVRQHICHHGNAKDSNIRQALIDRFGPPGTKKNPGLTYGLKRDLWQAFALAVTVYDQMRSLSAQAVQT